MKKYLITAIMLSALMLGIISCGDDDETPEPNNTAHNQQGNESNAPSVNTLAVDLGLSVKWANMNVGAIRPEDYGNYFAWGEITHKATYVWSTYTLCKGSLSTLTKYCNSSSYATGDNKTKLEFTDDAARVNWAGTWRMPTGEEWSELNTNCIWTWTTQNDVTGYLVTGPNGESIFLPAAGACYEVRQNNIGTIGAYWSSTRDASDELSARYLYFDNSRHDTYMSIRFYGLSVRPVTDPVTE